MSFFSTSIHAFEWDKCRKKWLSYFPGLPGGVMFSTSSYVSSTGECAMIGSLEYEEKLFIALNLDQFKVEVSQGEGEFLSAFSSLSSCSAVGEEHLKSILQHNYSFIFGAELNRSASEVYSRIQSLMLNDLVVRSECTPNA